MSLPINQFQYAGVWDVTKLYNQFQFVESPTNNESYVYIGNSVFTGGGDPATVQPSSIWIPLTSPIPPSSSSVLTQYLLPMGGLFTDGNIWVGPIAAQIGQFKLPPDVVPNSTVMLYWASWSVLNWGPLPNVNVLDFSFGFSDTSLAPPVNWYKPSAGFTVAIPNNANNVPLSIPFVPHTPSNPANPDYIQLPQWVIIPNAQSAQDIYLNLELPYLNDVLQDISVLAPFLLYQKL